MRTVRLLEFQRSPDGIWDVPPALMAALARDVAPLYALWRGGGEGERDAHLFGELVPKRLVETADAPGESVDGIEGDPQRSVRGAQLSLLSGHTSR